ncbi:MAG: hypothetical protein LW720_17780 [Pirellula sp.]|jgi:hypothetical protein|nr:hypothetical protein [Pirellula sp.]
MDRRTLRPTLFANALWLGLAATGFCQQPQSDTDPNTSSPGELRTFPSASDTSSNSEKSLPGKHRFEPSASKEYRVERARKESEARQELLQHYRAIGFDYAHPTFDGMALNPYRPKRRLFFVQPIRPW